MLLDKSLCNLKNNIKTVKKNHTSIQTYIDELEELEKQMLLNKEQSKQIDRNISFLEDAIKKYENKKTQHLIS